MARVMFWSQLCKNLKSMVSPWDYTTSHRKLTPTPEWGAVPLSLEMLRTWQFILRFSSQPCLAWKLKVITETVLDLYILQPKLLAQWQEDRKACSIWSQSWIMTLLEFALSVHLASSYIYLEETKHYFPPKQLSSVPFITFIKPRALSHRKFSPTT